MALATSLAGAVNGASRAAERRPIAERETALILLIIVAIAQALGVVVKGQFYPQPPVAGCAEAIPPGPASRLRTTALRFHWRN